MISEVTFTIADEATVSDWVKCGPLRLVGLILPTLDSATIGFEISRDGTNSLGEVYTNTHGSAPAALTLGTANTGGFVQAVPEDVGRLSAVAYIRLKVAAQNGGPRTVRGLCERVAS